MLLISASVVFLSSCIEEERLPYVVTIDADSIKYHSAVSGGYVSENAGPPVIAKGVCWGTSSKPTISDDHSFNGGGATFFTQEINGLIHNTTYYVRAYGENNHGLSYGNEISFTTLFDPNANWLPGDDWIDPRDGQLYGSVQIGEQVWMSENINFYTSTESSYYDHDSINNSEQYGRLYTINIASQACPEGWHLPSDEEWQCLEKELGMTQLELDLEGWRGSNQGDQLKIGGSSGFNADFGGYSYYFAGEEVIFSGINISGWFWTSTTAYPGADNYFIRIIEINNSQICRISLEGYKIENFLSIRCIKD